MSVDPTRRAIKPTSPFEGRQQQPFDYSARLAQLGVRIRKVHVRVLMNTQEKIGQHEPKKGGWKPDLSHWKGKSQAPVDLGARHKENYRPRVLSGLNIDLTKRSKEPRSSAGWKPDLSHWQKNPSK